MGHEDISWLCGGVLRKDDVLLQLVREVLCNFVHHIQCAFLDSSVAMLQCLNSVSDLQEPSIASQVPGSSNMKLQFAVSAELTHGTTLAKKTTATACYSIGKSRVYTETGSPGYVIESNVGACSAEATGGNHRHW